MRFKRHLFISYTHKDDKPLLGKGEGWVTRLHGALGVMLEQRLGYMPDIWRDKRLQGNEIFTPEIKSQLPDSAVLLAVVSDGYVASDWCRDEARIFCEAAEQSGGIARDNKSRVFKVFKAPPDTLEPLPQVMREMTGYNFYEQNAANAPKELDPDLDDTQRPKYVDQIATLAFHIKQLIKSLDAEDTPRTTASPAAPAKARVYLAECAHDRRADRDALAIDLAAFGYSVLPAAALPRDETAYREAVQAALAQCALAIHLVGNDSGWAPEGDSCCPGVALQNAESAAHSRQRPGSLRRIVSLPKGVTGNDEQARQFIDALHHDTGVQAGAMLIDADLQKLKIEVFALLAEIDKPKPAELPPADNGTRMVYLACDRNDLDAIDPLYALLVSQGCKVQLPAFPPNAQTARQAHEQRLAKCDAVLVFYGSGTKDWYASMLTDLDKAPALRGGRAITPAFTWVAPGDSMDKAKRLSLYPPDLIDATAGFDAALAAPFLVALGVAAHG